MTAAPTSQNAPRACEPCRVLKSRCVLVPDPRLSGQCQRCRKAGRECVFTERSTTKRPRRTAARIKELERRLEALVSSLNRGPVFSESATGNDQGLVEVGASLDEEDQSLTSTNVAESDVSFQNYLSSAISCGPQERSSTGSPSKEARSRETSNDQQNSIPRSRGLIPNDATDPILAHWSSHQRHQSTPRGSTPARDVTDQGFRSIKTGSQLSNRRDRESVSHHPIVVFPPGTSYSSNDTTLKSASSVSEPTSSTSQRRMRRPHTKSRSGCSSCKRRKMKVCLSLED